MRHTSHTLQGTMSIRIKLAGDIEADYDIEVNYDIEADYVPASGNGWDEPHEKESAAIRSVKAVVCKPAVANLAKFQRVDVIPELTKRQIELISVVVLPYVLSRRLRGA